MCDVCPLAVTFNIFDEVLGLFTAVYTPVNKCEQTTGTSEPDASLMYCPRGEHAVHWWAGRGRVSGTVFEVRPCYTCPVRLSLAWAHGACHGWAHGWAPAQALSIAHRRAQSS